MGKKLIIESGYKSYELIHKGVIELTPLMINLSEFTLFEKQKKFPNQLKLTKHQIAKLRKDLKKGDSFPPIIVEVNDDLSFFTIVDGMHRIIAYNEEKITTTKCLFVKRLGE